MHTSLHVLVQLSGPVRNLCSHTTEGDGHSSSGPEDCGRTGVVEDSSPPPVSCYATQLIDMNRRQIEAQGSPEEITTADLVRRVVVGLELVITPNPVASTPTVTPVGRHHA
jgi:hypothetical protein